MAELLSVGLDVGTTTTQMILSRLQVENKASSFAVPEMEIADRQILYKGAVHFTPLVDKDHVDGIAIRELIAKEYAAAGITPQAVDTGAIIITGETSRKENAKAVMDALSQFAGEFVVTTAGPHLESILAAKGSGAVAYSEKTGKTVLHMDIGGGTANLALIQAGQIIQTGCLNVGGRLLKFDPAGTVTYVSPVLAPLTALRPGDKPPLSHIENLAQLLTGALEMAAGLREKDPHWDALWTKEAGASWELCQPAEVISFSGGVADCIEKEQPTYAFGDMGPALGKAIRESKLCAGEYRLGAETIRATVIGAGCHSAQLSGSTVFYQNMPLPLKNLPVVPFEKPHIQQDTDQVVLTIPGPHAPTYEQICRLANEIADRWQGEPVLVALENDMAKALGHALSLRLPKDTPILCIDRVKLTGDSYLDIGNPVGPCLPVVVKTLVLQNNSNF